MIRVNFIEIHFCNISVCVFWKREKWGLAFPAPNILIVAANKTAAWTRGPRPVTLTMAGATALRPLLREFCVVIPCNTLDCMDPPLFRGPHYKVQAGLRTSYQDPDKNLHSELCWLSQNMCKPKQPKRCSKIIWSGILVFLIGKHILILRRFRNENRRY